MKADFSWYFVGHFTCLRNIASQIVASTSERSKILMKMDGVIIRLIDPCSLEGAFTVPAHKVRNASHLSLVTKFFKLGPWSDCPIKGLNCFIYCLLSKILCIIPDLFLVCERVNSAEYMPMYSTLGWYVLREW